MLANPRLLRRVLREAQQGTAFYGKRLAGSTSPERAHAGGLTARMPLTRAQDLAAEKIETGDPYSGRLARGRQPLVTLQLETPEETPLYAGFDRSDLERYAEALRRCLVLLGAQSGDTIALFDYGTSPVTYLASSLYTPYLRTGAADAIGCTTICNDGMPSLSKRAVEILRYVRPRYLFLRVESLQPFLSACEAGGFPVSRHTEALVATHDEGRLDPGLRAACEERLRVPVFELARVDLAAFFAMECPECRLYHTWDDLYLVETVAPDSLEPVAVGEPGLFVVTNRFARVCPAIRILTRLEGRVTRSGCPRGPEDLRLAR